MHACAKPRPAVPRSSHAPAQPADLGARRRRPSRRWPGPRLSSRRGAARSGRASVGTRRPTLPRGLAPSAPPDPTGTCLAATPSAGPAHSTRPDPIPASPRHLSLVRRLLPCQSSRSRCLEVDSRPRTRGTSGLGQDRLSMTSASGRILKRPPRPAAPHPNARYALQLKPAELPAHHSTRRPLEASRSQDLGRHRPSQLRSTPGLGAHGRSAQLLFRRELPPGSAIQQVRRAPPLRAPPLRPAQRARPQRAHSAQTTEHQQVLVPTRPPWATENLQAHHPNRELQATQRQRHGLPGPGHVVRVARHQVIPRPRLVHQRWATRGRQNAPCCSVPGARAVHPPRDRRGGNHLELRGAPPSVGGRWWASPGRSALRRSESAPLYWPAPGADVNQPRSESNWLRSCGVASVDLAAAECAPDNGATGPDPPAADVGARPAGDVAPPPAVDVGSPSEEPTDPPGTASVRCPGEPGCPRSSPVRPLEPISAALGSRAPMRSLEPTSAALRSDVPALSPRPASLTLSSGAPVRSPGPASPTPETGALVRSPGPASATLGSGTSACSSEFTSPAVGS